MDLSNTPGLHHVGYTSHPKVNHGRSLPLFEPVAPEGRPGINSLEGWNAAADRQNRRAFVMVFGREPVCIDELRAWEDSHFPKDFRWEGMEPQEEVEK